MSWQVTAQYWQNENVLCDLACCRLRDPDDPEDQGSWVPDPECEVHWQPWAHGLRARLYQERVERHRERRELEFWRRDHRQRVVARAARGR